MKIGHPHRVWGEGSADRVWGEGIAGEEPIRPQMDHRTTMVTQVATWLPFGPTSSLLPPRLVFPTTKFIPPEQDLTSEKASQRRRLWVGFYALSHVARGSRQWGSASARGFRPACRGRGWSMLARLMSGNLKRKLRK